jgi:2-C-methyl-D-erythritol 4-phosphate cytidylyltransferase
VRVEKENIRVAAIIPAAGTGKRMNAGLNKVWLRVNDECVITHTLKVFQNSDLIERIVLVVNETELDQFREYLDAEKSLRHPVDLAAGGEERQESVFNGLKYLQKQPGWSDCRCLAVIHDAARLLLTGEILNFAIRMGIEHRAIGIGVPVKDTIKQIDREGMVVGSPDRATLWAVQTPQVFDFDLLYESYQNAAAQGLKFTDDCGAVEHFGHPVKLVMGSYENLKITTPEDLLAAETILRRRANANRSRI